MQSATSTASGAELAASTAAAKAVPKVDVLEMSRAARAAVVSPSSNVAGGGGVGGGSAQVRAGPPQAKLTRRQEAQVREAEQRRVQEAVKTIKGTIEITEEDQEATVKAVPTDATHLVDLSPDFEDEEVAEAALQAKAKRDAEEAAKKTRPELAEGGVVRKSTKCQTTSAVYVEPKPKMKPRARPKFLAKWFLEAFGRRGVADAALAAAATATVPFAFDTIPEGDEEEGAVCRPCPPPELRRRRRTQPRAS